MEYTIKVEVIMFLGNKAMDTIRASPQLQNNSYQLGNAAFSEDEEMRQ